MIAVYNEKIHARYYFLLFLGGRINCNHRMTYLYGLHGGEATADSREEKTEKRKNTFIIITARGGGISFRRNSRYYHKTRLIIHPIRSKYPHIFTYIQINIYIYIHRLRRRSKGWAEYICIVWEERAFCKHIIYTRARPNRDTRGPRSTINPDREH